MYTIKGFARNTELANNTPGNISQLGELTLQSMTYCKEAQRGYYVDRAKGVVEFVSFQSKTLAGSFTPVPTTYQTLILSVINWLYDRAKASALPNNPTQVAALVQQEFSSSLQQVQCSAMVAKGNIILPGAISFVKTEGANNNTVKVWFSDDAFQQEFDGYSHTIIPPVDELDSLFEPSPTVETLVRSRTLTQLFEIKEEAIGIDPPTDEAAQRHNRVSVMSPTSIPTDWTILTYGAAGNDLDAIRQALQDYLAANSARPLADWRVIFPSIFLATEFTIIPHFNKIAIENQEVEAGIYNSYVNTTEALAYATLGIPSGVNNFVPYIRTFPTTYKSLVCTSFGGADNADGIRDLETKFPKYIVAPTGSVDFGRMPPETQDYVRLLYKLIQAAETMTSTSSLPAGVKRIIRNGKVYATGSLTNVQYLVYAKSNFQ